MRFVAYREHDRRRIGEMTAGRQIVPLENVDVIDAATDLGLLSTAPRDYARAVAMDDVVLLPVSIPKRIVCVGLNYSGHIRETKREESAYPVLFTKFSSSLVGATDDIRVPRESQQVDYEGELVVVIGRRGRRIPVAEAEDHILGYAAGNDVTMRDYQYKTHQWLQGKAWDESTPVGPAIVTPDEIALEDQRLTTRVNGEVVQSSGLDSMIFSVLDLVAAVSEFTMLEPGDMIFTGTPEGVGFRRDPQLFLQPGDQVSVEITGIGEVCNRVVAEHLD